MGPHRDFCLAFGPAGPKAQGLRRGYFETKEGQVWPRRAESNGYFVRISQPASVIRT